MKKQNCFIKTICLLNILISVVSGNIIIQGFTPREIDRATIQFEYKRLYKILAPAGPIDTSRLTIIFYSKAVESNERYSLPEWGGGGAIGTEKIVVNIDKNPFLDHSPYQVTVHELAHIVINRISMGIAVPRWFHEGVAMLLSGEATEREQIVLSKALFAGSVMPLYSIDSVNSFGRFRAELAYCQSRQTVLFLIDTYGIEILAEVLEAAIEKGTFWGGFHDVLQVTPRELDLFARKFIYQNHGKYLWLVDEYLVWVVILFLFLLAYIITIFRIRAKKKRMEEEEVHDQISQAEKENASGFPPSRE